MSDSEDQGEVARPSETYDIKCPDCGKLFPSEIPPEKLSPEEVCRLRRALDQCRLASGLSKAEIIDAALSGAPSETPQPASKEPALLLSRAAKWLAVQRGESAKSTRELIEQLVAEVDRLRETLQRYIEHHEHCTITQYYGVREKSELSRLRDAQETDDPSKIPCPNPGCTTPLWARHHIHAIGPTPPKGTPEIGMAFADSPADETPAPQTNLAWCICSAYEHGFGQALRDVSNPYSPDTLEGQGWEIGRAEGKRRQSCAQETMEIVSVMEKALREIGEFTIKSHVQPVRIARDTMRKIGMALKRNKRATAAKRRTVTGSDQ